MLIFIKLSRKYKATASWFSNKKKTLDTTITIMIAKTSAVNAKVTDSVKNCRIKLLLRAPTTLRMPTSRARLAERAVARFIKLMQAITKTKIAIIEKI